MSDIIKFPKPHNNPAAEPDVETSISVETVLQAAMDNDLTEVIVVGRNPDKTFFLSSSSSSKERMIYMLERMKHFIMELP